MRIGVTLLAGLAAFVALFPFSGQDSDPPTFYSVFHYEVPVGGVWLSLLAGIVAAVLVWVACRRERAHPRP